MEAFNFCDYFAFIFVSYCASQNAQTVQKRNADKFEVEYRWNFINFTWISPEDYANAFDTEKYVPGHNVLAGVKIYKDHVYLALPRRTSGSTVTLAVIPKWNKYKDDVLLRPYPNWRMNIGSNCATLQNVQSMEIDSKGIMWVLDGNRYDNFTTCPAKLVLLDLKNRGKVVNMFEFPNELCANDGGFLNDLVVDETDGGFAYMTESSAHDPGIIVYSKIQKRAWKLRDKSMFAEIADNLINQQPIDGIALSPVINRKTQDRVVYYSAFTGLNLHAIGSRILKNENFCKTGMWRRFVKTVGRKDDQSDGLAMDNEGNLYYGLLNRNGVARWNIYKPFNSSKIIDQNNETLIWPASFTFDSEGFLYVLSSDKFSNTSSELNDGFKFRLSKIYTGTRKYS